MGNVESSSPEDSSREVVNLGQFKIMKTIGQGSFGKVFKVEHVQRRERYALKVISKEKCIKMEAVSNIIRERTILESVDHPLVCNMRFAFQDELCMYMAMDFMSGGDLRCHLAKKQHDERTIQFWMAELICAVKYLHSQGIVHRDIKPDNILLDHQGHVHLSDFNIACQIPHHEKPLVSLSGTAVYFAPEMFKGTGYNEDVDWWSVGITFYECIYGTRPWSHCTNIDELGKQIIQKVIPFPKTNRQCNPISTHCISAIRSFLEKDPKKRMGRGILTGWNKIALHPFFRSIDWYRMDDKQCTPAYTPSQQVEEIKPITQSELSATNHHFLIQQNSCEQQLPENDGIMGWLYRQKRTSRVVQNRASQDMKLLQNHFKLFDYTIFDQYEGFLDQHLMTVGPPPDWVKPAFPGADNGSLLPIRKLCLETTPTVFDVFSSSNRYQYFNHTTAY